MPGFVFHLHCNACRTTSPEYSLYVFPDVFRAEITLPAWSLRFRCYTKVYCYLGEEDRTILEKNRDRLREFATGLSSPGMTVGVPVWSLEAGKIEVRVEPSPTCPFCGGSVEARSGYPPKETLSLPQDIDDPFSIPLPMLGLSVRAINCLEYAGICSLGRLCACSQEELLAIPRLGDGTIQEIRERIEAIGCRLRES